MSDAWKLILERKTEAQGRAVVARELAVSTSTLSLIINGKYPASTDRIERRVMAMYGDDGLVVCPVLGPIEPSLCVDKWELAHKIRGAGNPATIRLFIACRKCDLRIR